MILFPFSFILLIRGGYHLLGTINFVILIGILTVGLWPFNFWPQNKVEWLRDRNGVHFYGQGIIFSESSIPLFSSLASTLSPQSSLLSPAPSFSIELWLEPDTEPNSLPHIFSLYDGQATEPLFIGQWKSSLVLRTRMPDPKRSRPYREIGLRNALVKGQERFIAITSDEKGTSIYVNGRMERAYPNHILIPSEGILSYHIILGNSATGKGYWKGNLFRLTVSNRALTGEEILRHFEDGLKTDQPSPLNEEGLIALYTFGKRLGRRIQDHIGNHHLRLPDRFEILRRDILTSPRKDFRFNWSYLKDVIINILGFIPFGFFVSVYLREKKIRSRFLLFFIPILLGGCLSLMIELLQAYLPTRSSQMTDLLTNILGTAIGVAIWQRLKAKGQR